MISEVFIKMVGFLVVRYIFYSFSFFIGFHLSGTVKDSTAEGLYSESDNKFRVSVNFDRLVNHFWYHIANELKYEMRINPVVLTIYFPALLYCKTGFM